MPVVTVNMTVDTELLSTCIGISLFDERWSIENVSRSVDPAYNVGDDPPYQYDGLAATEGELASIEPLPRQLTHPKSIILGSREPRVLPRVCDRRSSR